jgi:hypothetical protein
MKEKIINWALAILTYIVIASTGLFATGYIISKGVQFAGGLCD